MLISVLATAIIFLADLVSLYGWGRAILAASGQEQFTFPFYAVAVGMGSPAATLSAARGWIAWAPRAFFSPSPPDWVHINM